MRESDRESPEETEGEGELIEEVKATESHYSLISLLILSLLILPISSLIFFVYHSLSLLVLVVSCVALCDPTVTLSLKSTLCGQRL